MLYICVGFLFFIFASACDEVEDALHLATEETSSSMFPVADMDLKLTFDLAPQGIALRSQQCFSFFPNAPFQGS